MVIGLGVGALIAASDGTGLAAATNSFVFACLGMLCSTISASFIPMVWIGGLTFSLMGFGYGVYTRSAYSGTAQTIGGISLGISGVGIVLNFAKLGGVIDY